MDRLSQEGGPPRGFGARIRGLIPDRAWALCCSSSPADLGLSTFSGVFVPCINSIFGVVIFLRMGFVVGEAGVLEALGMFSIAYAAVLLTVLSMSAISTNGAIRGYENLNSQ
jgi:hypothetical protein